MKNTYKLIAIASACLLAGLHILHAGTFVITADGTVITSTNTGQASNNASVGYDNAITNSRSSFVYGGTNSVSNAANTTIVGSNNDVSSPSSLDTAYIFGDKNAVGLNGSGSVYLFGTRNLITNDAGNGNSNPHLANAYAIGSDNRISNIGYMSDVFAVGVTNIIKGGRNIGGPSDVSNVFIFGANNNLHNIPNSNEPTLTNAYAIGSGNTMSSAGISKNVYQFGSNNKMLNESVITNADGSITGGYAFGDSNIINVPISSNIINVYAIGVSNTLGDGHVAAPSSTMNNAYAIGSRNYVISSNAVAIGINNAITHDNTFVLGGHVVSGNPNGVILGNNSADGIINPVVSIAIGAKAPVSVSGTAPVGIVSVGALGKERQIINVAAGRVTVNSTDAINGSELFVTNTTLAALSETVAILVSNTAGSAGDALLWSSTLNAYDASHNTGIAQHITNIANGAINATSRDAINGSQLYGTATSIVNILGTGTVNPDGTITGVTFITGGTTINQVITNLYNSATNSVADALLWNGTLNAYDAAHGTGIAQRITNVANGAISAASRDAINGSQLYGTATSIVNLFGTGSVNPDGIITGGQFIINGGTFNNITSAFTNLSETINNFFSGSTGFGLVRQDIFTGNITIGATASGTLLNIAGTDGNRQLTGVADGVADNDAVNVGQLKATGIFSDTGTSGILANVVSYDSATKITITLGGPLATGTGANITGGTRITNLALAAINAASTDAVTGSQLFDTNQRVTNLENTVAVLVSATHAPVAVANPHFTTGNDDASIPATATGGNAVAAGMGATASGASSSAVGMGAKATAAKSIAIGSLSESHASGGIALGNNAVVVAAATNSVAIGSHSIATEPDTVSFGSDTIKRRLVNIADGISPYDAVNMRQLSSIEGAVNGRIDSLQTQVNDVSDRLDRVGAMSAAINQVQTPLGPDGRRSQLAMGIGVHRGHGAFAMGYSHISRLGDCGIRASFALSDRADIMAGTGVIYAW